MRERAPACVSLLALTCLHSPAGSATGAAPDCTLERATGTTIDPQPLLTNAYNVRWNRPTGRLAYMQPDDSGYYRVWTMRPDGSDRQALTAHREGLPDKHQGALYWHPSGRYVLFTAQKEAWRGRRLFGIPDYEALPGFGRHDDLWLISADGAHSWQLTNEPNTLEEGALMPVFSADGRHVAWSARGSGGNYVLTIADFSELPQPHLTNPRTYQPGGRAYYETGSFTSDGHALIYTSDQDTHSFWASQLYRLDLATGFAMRLTVGRDYNEHPTVVPTRAGDWIVYMSTRGVERRAGHLMLGTDWYAMRVDGSASKRLTRMNLNRSDDAENTGQPLVAGTVAVSPGGDYMLGDVQDSLVHQTGQVKVVRFTCAP
jgi:Tol biopolymer transport system component